MVAAIAVAAVTAGAAAYSASSQSSAAKQAAQGQQESADEAIALQREQWQQGRADIAPWRQAGIRALGQFEDLAQHGPPQFGPFRGPPALQAGQFAFRPPTAADMMQDPGYQFRLQQGQQALERSAAARGGLLSGGFARGAQEYGQNMASQEYGNVYQRRLGENQQRYGRALAQNQSAYERALQRYTTNYNSGMGQWQARLQPWQTLAGGGQQAGSMAAASGPIMPRRWGVSYRPTPRPRGRASWRRPARGGTLLARRAVRWAGGLDSGAGGPTTPPQRWPREPQNRTTSGCIDYRTSV